MSTFWSMYITILTLLTIGACYWIIRWTTKTRPDESAQGQVTGHTWDDDLQEYNNPLPRWWLGMFYLTIFFSLGYLAFYPGLGNMAGRFGWTQINQYEQEMQEADRTYGPIFAAFAKQDIAVLAKDPRAMAAGRNLFLNNCATCHGSDAQGAPGFPNLADNDWIFGGEAQTIKDSILKGRVSLGMPAMGMGMPEATLSSLVDYVLSLSGQASNAESAAAGKAIFVGMCVACHGAEGKGMPALGAPNLADKIWLYGGTPAAIKETLLKGRKGIMPAHADILGDDKAHLIAAYVYGLSVKSQ